MSHRRFGPLLGLLLTLGAAGALSEPASEREQFREAYARYQAMAEAENWPEALPWAKESWQLASGLLGPGHATVARLGHNYALTLARVGDDAAAEQAFVETIRAYEQAFGADSEELIPLLLDSADLERTPFNYLREQRLERAEAIAAAHYGEQSQAFSEFSTELGLLLFKHRQFNAGRQALERGYRVANSTLGPAHLTTAYAAYRLGEIELADGDFEDADQHLQQALATYQGAAEDTTAMQLVVLQQRFYLARRQGDAAGAQAALARIGELTPGDAGVTSLYETGANYPSLAERHGSEGDVTVQYTVDENGAVQSPTVIASTGGTLFHNPSLEAARKFLYVPGFADGRPVATEGVQHTFTFRMAY